MSEHLQTTFPSETSDRRLLHMSEQLLQDRLIYGTSYEKEHADDPVQGEVPNVPGCARGAVLLPNSLETSGQAFNEINYGKVFAERGGAVRAARKLAANQMRVVDLVRIADRGEVRCVIKQFEPTPRR